MRDIKFISYIKGPLFLLLKRRANIITVMTIRIIFSWFTAYLEKVTRKIQTAVFITQIPKVKANQPHTGTKPRRLGGQGTCLRFAQWARGGVKESKENREGWQELGKQRREERPMAPGDRLREGAEAGPGAAFWGHEAAHSALGAGEGSRVRPSRSW